MQDYKEYNFTLKVTNELWGDYVTKVQRNLERRNINITFWELSKLFDGMATNNKETGVLATDDLETITVKDVGDGMNIQAYNFDIIVPQPVI